MHTRRLVIVSILAVVVVAGVLFIVFRKDSGDPSYLFLLNAGNGTLEQKTDRNYKLTLSDVSDITVVFSDRPIRQAHIIHTADFAASFGDLFGDDPPNAALNFMLDDAQTEADYAVFIIHNPKYDADAEIFTCDVEIIPLDDSMEGVSSDDVALLNLPTAFAHSTLFVDSTDVKVTYVNNSLNPDQPTIFVFAKNVVPTFDVLVDG